MTREQIEERCPTDDLCRKSRKECWVLGFEAALRNMEIHISETLLGSIKNPCRDCEGDGLPGTCAGISSLGRCPLEYRKEESIGEDLEEAAAQSEMKQGRLLFPYRQGFKDGAQWKQQQMMKDAKAGVVEGAFIKFSDGTWIDLDPSMQFDFAFKVNDGEKVMMLMVKDQTKKQL